MGSPVVIRTVAEMRKYSAAAGKEKKSVALVPTMGAIHPGHERLVRETSSRANICVASIFVNPLQFSAGEDYESYKRDEEGDIGKLSKAGADAVFLPSSDEIYPPGFQTSVEVENLQSFLCGVSRPGHFRGVATVVLKLFNIVRPAVAGFGEKDFQQLAIIRRMVGDLNLDIEIFSVPTVRDSSGLAISSRNEYLSEEEMRRAVVIPQVLFRMKKLFDSGVKGSSDLRKAGVKIAADTGVLFEYLEVCDPETLVSVETVSDGNLIAVAAKVGKARLIDSIRL